MTYLSIIEKFKILFNTLLDLKIILIFSTYIIILTLLYSLKQLSRKRYTRYITLSLIVIFMISIVGNIEPLSNTFDDFLTIIFRDIYFPSTYIYISTLIIVLVSFFITSLNPNTKKVYKIINRSMFIINSILLAIILNIIANNRIDIFSINSLYTNTSLVAILELDMGIFLTWIAVLFIAYITNCVCERIYKKKENKKEIKNENTIVENIPLEINNIEETIIPTQEIINITQTAKPILDDFLPEPYIESNLNVESLVKDYSQESMIKEFISPEPIITENNNINNNIFTEMTPIFNNENIVDQIKYETHNLNLSFQDIFNQIIYVENLKENNNLNDNIITNGIALNSTN